MAKVRVRAWVAPLGNGLYTIKRSDGITRGGTYTLAEAQRECDYINNEDSDYPEYIDEPTIRFF